MRFPKTPVIVDVDVAPRLPPVTDAQFAEALKFLTDGFVGMMYTDDTMRLIERRIDALVSSFDRSRESDMAFATRQSLDDEFGLDIWVGRRDDPEMPHWANAKITPPPDGPITIRGDQE
ncbi:hypothetical protein [Parvibaculum sp.]|uniref:hypothetical protein n=1 Tax=Parvibaculum sp. TaxID=2024848 RepID=UPI002736D210|nr:hypothetical protein [Parvibaculum sp.]MDP3328765.1 hypothetical protein [Parvibaculum sp.]